MKTTRARARQLELVLWESVKDGSPAELESYLEQYPEGTFASLAQTRLDAAALSPPEDPVEPTPAQAAVDACLLSKAHSIRLRGHAFSLTSLLSRALVGQPL